MPISSQIHSTLRTLNELARPRILSNGGLRCFACPIILVRPLSLAASRHLRPGVAQTNRAVEHRPAWLAVGIATEIALPLELHGLRRIVPRQRGLDHRPAQHL